MLASPTPAPAGIVRRTSQRQALRRPTSRSMLARAESQQHLASGGAGPGPSVDSMADQSKQYHDDSSEDEIPVPMKLSALTKALLNDPEEAAMRGPSPPRTRRQASILNSSTGSGQGAEEMRQLRSRSVQRQEPARIEKDPVPEKSREQSPVRKRVVRLSRDSQGFNQSGSGSVKRRSTSMSRNTRMDSQQPPSRPSSRTESHERFGEEKAEPQREVNTPSQAPLRVVRVSSSSSVKRRIAARRSSGLNADASAVDGSALDLAQDRARREEAESVLRTGSSATKSSGSRYPSASIRNRSEENPNPQSSMRIKRVGKTPGGFLSGPARRGKRRQSEEEGGDEGLEGEQMFSSQERRMQAAEDGVALSYVRDFNSGSPISSNAAARAVHRRQASQADQQPEPRQPSPRGISLSKKDDPLAAFEAELPSPKGINVAAPTQDKENIDLRRPLRPELPSNLDQENEVPASWRRSKPSVDLIMEKIPSRPLEADMPPVKGISSPERKPLAAITKNTPSRSAPPPPPKMSVLETATSNGGAAATTQAKQRRNVLRVNGKVYTRLDCIGRGGSAKVYRVSAENGHMFALKRVSLENTDEMVLRGYRGEIDLLTKLNGVERVINLFDHELNSEKKVLYLLMEMGELDLGSVLKARHALDESKFDPVFTRFYWKEMLECLQSVHQYSIVHSDLKPANFVLVRGRLKLIDFGIANAIADYTKNVHRDTQIGTPNYMSPESLLDSNSPANNPGARMAGLPKLMKLGKPSDVWSLGCILYQMVYGTPPFGHIANPMARCQAIINVNHNIEYPLHAPCGTRIPNSVIKTMRSCLNRDPSHRPTVDQLLKEFDAFLYPRELPNDSLPVDREMLGRIVQDAVRKYVEGQEHPDPRKRPNRDDLRKEFSDDYWRSLKKAAVAKGVMW